MAVINQTEWTGSDTRMFPSPSCIAYTEECTYIHRSDDLRNGDVLGLGLRRQWTNLALGMQHGCLILSAHDGFESLVRCGMASVYKAQGMTTELSFHAYRSARATFFGSVCGAPQLQYSD